LDLQRVSAALLIDSIVKIVAGCGVVEDFLCDLCGILCVLCGKKILTAKVAKNSAKYAKKILKNLQQDYTAM
jgi:hypothetical protein